MRSFLNFTRLRDKDPESEGGDGLETTLKPAGPEVSDSELAGLLGLKTGAAAQPAKKKAATPAKKKAADADFDEDEEGDEDERKPKGRAKGEAEDDEGDEAAGEGKKKKQAAADPLAAALRAAAGEEGEEEDSDDDDDADDDHDGEDDPKSKKKGEGDEDDDEDLDEDDAATRDGFNPAQQKRFDKAISKKTRRILDLREELAEEKAEKARVAAELDTARKSPAAAAAPTADNPLADIDDEAKLDARLTDARKLRRFALTNPDGAYVDTKTGTVVEVADGDDPPAGTVQFTKRRIGEILADSEELLQEHGPKRRAFLQQRTKDEASALTEVPWLKNKNSPGALAIEAQLRDTPALRGVPGIRLLLADAFIGRHLRATAAAAKTRPGAGADRAAAGKETKAPPSPGSGTRGPKVDGKRKAAAGALLTVATTGDDPDNAGLRALLQS